MSTITIKCARCKKPITELNQGIHGTFCRGFRPYPQKPVNIQTGAEENRGWTVFGVQDFKKTEGGAGWSEAGYIFDTEEKANKFYESEKE